MSKRPIHELAPTTHRSARLLSKIYGFKNPEAFADSLPEEAVVVDYGAGNSNLGATIAGLRSDIQWLNVDLRYGSKYRYPRKRVIRKAPINLHFIGSDVLKPSIQPGSVDRMISNALLPHLIMTDEALAADAIGAMGELLNEDGEMLLGKKFRSFAFRVRDDRSVRISAREFHADPVATSEHIISEVRISSGVEAMQYVANHMNAAWIAGRACVSDIFTRNPDTN